MSNTTAELAAEFWKLLKGFERSIALLPEEARMRFLAQTRYATNRLDAILREVGMRVVTFDGDPFEPNMPAVAVNADDVDLASEMLIVERTLEPAVIEGVTVVITGKVYLIKATASLE